MKLIKVHEQSVYSNSLAAGTEHGKMPLLMNNPFFLYSLSMELSKKILEWY